ncbi:type I phosphomannose isomerase catalytic subunit [Vibrio sp. S12_S33]|uniref:type I phosphomannose isomerase catalytic subunit n=1 Tax=Vibrio sp. S12_S33 TaxID=2720223 RepID=UPI00177D23C8|nr:type I phosphomannose isomerase catalytic subunit [Vibrio sp. S12_S33]MBD1567207.1 hypothetical protein [Vibrio sp. S12_S33]
MKTTYTLERRQQHYQWGSHILYGLFGLPQKGDRPLVELWLGGHPSLPSNIQIDDESWQGGDQFFEKKPLNFLFKVLSASQSFSLQVHPMKTKQLMGLNVKIN